jgi:hypothetical protein
VPLWPQGFRADGRNINHYIFFRSRTARTLFDPGSGKITVFLAVHPWLRRLRLVVALFVVGPLACAGPRTTEYESALGAKPRVQQLTGWDAEDRYVVYTAHKSDPAAGITSLGADGRASDAAGGPPLGGTAGTRRPRRRKLLERPQHKPTLCGVSNTRDAHILPTQSRVARSGSGCAVVPRRLGV